MTFIAYSPHIPAKFMKNGKNQRACNHYGGSQVPCKSCDFFVVLATFLATFLVTFLATGVMRAQVTSQWKMAIFELEINEVNNSHGTLNICWNSLKVHK